MIGRLSEQGYSAGYVSFFSHECERLVGYMSSGGTFEAYLQGYCERYGLKLSYNREWVIDAIYRWFEDGQQPSRRHPLRRKATSYTRLSGLARSHVDAFIASCCRGLSASSQATMSHKVSAFLLHLEQSPGGLLDATEDTVWSYFYDSCKDIVRHGYGICSVIRRFLRWAGGLPDGACYAHILPLVPMMKQTRDVFDCLTEEEDKHLLAYVLDDGCSLSLRDRGIFAMARFCGLRACDIVALRMSDIDLGRSRLTVRQRKTGRQMEMALRPVVGNAVCRYVMQERPVSDLPELFLVDERDVRPLTPNAVGNVCNKVFRLAEIRQEGKRRGGSHLLRHRFAQSLVEGGACDSAAMRLLGHASPVSLDVYLETDIRRLRDCAIGISDFGTGKEVLG